MLEDKSAPFTLATSEGVAEQSAPSSMMQESTPTVCTSTNEHAYSLTETRHFSNSVSARDIEIDEVL